MILKFVKNVVSVTSCSLNVLDFMDLIYRSILSASALLLHRINFFMTQSRAALVLAVVYFAVLCSVSLFSGYPDSPM